MACYLPVVESEDRKNKSRDAEAPDTNCPGRILGMPNHLASGRGEPTPTREKQAMQGNPLCCKRRTRGEERRDGAGFLATELDDLADLTLLLLLQAGDVERNPGPKRTIGRVSKRTTVKNRPTNNLLMGDSIIAAVENKLWNIRAVHGGNPTDLREWVQKEPNMFSMENVAILIGGNAVCSRNNQKPISTPDRTVKEIFELVRDLKKLRVKSIKVLGVPKRRCKEDMKDKQQSTSSEQPPPSESDEELPKPDACKTGENGSITAINDKLRASGEEYGYTFVGVGKELASESVFADDGVHLSSTGVSHLAKLLRKCL